MKKIQILGTGCPKCKTLAEHATEAVQKSGGDFEVVKITDIMEITSFGIMMTPAIAIDGEVKSVGKLLSVEEIMELIK